MVLTWLPLGCSRPSLGCYLRLLRELLGFSWLPFASFLGFAFVVSLGLAQIVDFGSVVASAALGPGFDDSGTLPGPAARLAQIVDFGPVAASAALGPGLHDSGIPQGTCGQIRSDHRFRTCGGLCGPGAWIA